jgi:hypothetical protein
LGALSVTAAQLFWKPVGEVGVFIRLFLLGGLSLSVLIGCSNKPSRIKAPSWDPDDFADAIMEKLDANTDGSIDAKELTGAPGLEWGARYIDTDKNQQLSRDELVARFEKYVQQGVGLTSKQMQLIYKGRPLVGAKVTLVPEFFLAEVIEPATGEAEIEGMFSPITQGAEVPGVRAGYYRVVVESPNVKIPAKYTSADSTPLGAEISSLGDDQRSYGTIRLVLTD